MNNNTLLKIKVSALRKVADDIYGELEKMESETAAPRVRQNKKTDRMARQEANFMKYKRNGS